MHKINYNGLFHWLQGLPNVWVCTDDLWFNQDDEEYVAYTDGSCDNLNRKRPGGAAYIIMRNNEIIRAKNKGFLGTSNNRTEMLAIISAVCYTPQGSRLDIYTDSQYSMDIFSGKCNPKKNKDLVEMFKKYAKPMKLIVFHWIKGHNGDKYNEMVDKMAYSAYKEIIAKHNIPEGKYVKGGFK